MGKNYLGLSTDYLVEISDTQSDKFSPELFQQVRTQLYMARNEGHWLSTIIAEFGLRILCYMTLHTKTL